MASNLESTIHSAPRDIAIVRATVDDVPAVLHLLDTAVKWLVSRDRTGQWGAGPFSENPRRAEQLKEFATTGHGLWLAVKIADGTAMDQNQPSNILPKTVNGETPGSIIGALAVGERMPYVTPVSESELYVRLLVTDRQWAGNGVGKRLLEHARDLANGAGVSLLRVDCYAGGDGKLVQYYESQGFKRFETLNLEGGWPCQVLVQHLREVELSCSRFTSIPLLSKTGSSYDRRDPYFTCVISKMTPEGVEGEAGLHDSSHKTTTTISDSSFFREHRASTLPTPAEVRAINEESGNIRGTSFNRPPPVELPSLGLIIKYGADTTVTEAKTQKMIYNQLKGKVPVPEVFGWTEDGGQVFIYMSLIAGEPLEERWGALKDDEREAVCKELNGMVKAWRSLEQPDQVLYVGGLDNQPLNDIFLSGHRDLAGPFYSADAVQKFQNGCDIEIDGEVPVVFTHDDLVPPNILLSPETNPVVASIIDWGQAGWYPAYWEYCKAHRVRPNPEYFDEDLHEEWKTRYLPTILDPVDDETVYHPWLWFVLSKGI
ncbi:hypothetical protein N7501_000921 [Penicillium viridicatum]|nr:hypothetical protein N7501_000921 [Penicillium viridicatum]